MGCRKQQKLSICLFPFLAVFARLSITPALCLFKLTPSFSFIHTLWLSLLHLPVSSSLFLSLHHPSLFLPLLSEASSLSLSATRCCFWVMCGWWRMLGDDRWMWQADGFACRLFNHTNSVGHEVGALSCQSNTKWRQIYPVHHRFWYRKRVGICEERG